MAKTAEEITEKASSYLKNAGFSWTKIVRVIKKNGNWEVIADVGIIKPIIKTITISEDGEIVEYR